MDNTQKFDGRAEAYISGRPAYAEAFIKALYSEFGFTEKSVVADVGSGTGIFTEQLLKKGSTVFAVEPNADMRKKAEQRLKEYKNFHSVDGTAENTSLADGAAQFITVAQAFHWFDVSSFKTECRRILKRAGKVFLIWNTRDTQAEINARQQSVFKRFCLDFKGFGGGIAEDDDRIYSFFNGQFEYREYANPLFYDREKYISRCLSSSYSLKESNENFEAYLKELGGLFDEFAVDGILTVPNKTQVYFGKII